MQMLPVPFSYKWATLPAKALDAAPFYELLLFRTRLRFRNPRPTEKTPGHGVDSRPFINSVTKQGYTGDKERGIAATLLYVTGWRITDGRLLPRKLATVGLRLAASGVVGNEVHRHVDLYDEATARQWILDYAQRMAAAAHQFLLVPLSDQYFELNFRDEAGSDLAEQVGSLEILTFAINGHAAHCARLMPNQLTYFIPFSPHDMLRFEFTLSTDTALSDAVKQRLQGEASAFANSLIHTVELHYPDRALPL